MASSHGLGVKWCTWLVVLARGKVVQMASSHGPGVKWCTWLVVMARGKVVHMTSSHGPGVKWCMHSKMRSICILKQENIIHKAPKNLRRHLKSWN